MGAVSYQAVASSIDSIKPSRSSYKKYTPKDRYRIGKYASETGSTAAVRKFKDKFPKLNESTVREFRKKYQDQLKAAEKIGSAPDKELIPLPRGRPLLLGADIDEKVRKFIMALRYRGGQATFSIAIAVAKALIDTGNDEGLKVIQFGKDWAQSFYRRMGFQKRAATTGKVTIPEGARKEAELVYLYDIVNKIETNEIPPQLVFNMDQTPSKYIQSSRYTMEKSGQNSVAIAGSDDKRAITATFIIDLKGTFLPMQLIYGGKTNRSIPSVKFPKGFSLSANPKHYSNEEETKKIILDIIVPHINSVKKNLQLPESFPSLLIMDVFRGQMTANVQELLNEHNILVTFVPNNMTHLFQPLDLTVNSWAKKFMKEKFAMWYCSKIKEALDKGIAIDEIDIKTPLTMIKPLHAKWLIEMYDELTSDKGRNVVVNGWRASGILEAVEIGSVNLQSLDPFQDIDPTENLAELSDMFYDYPEKNHGDVNERYETDSEDEYFIDEDRSAFDCIVNEL